MKLSEDLIEHILSFIIVPGEKKNLLKLAFVEKKFYELLRKNIFRRRSVTNFSNEILKKIIYNRSSFKNNNKIFINMNDLINNNINNLYEAEIVYKKYAKIRGRSMAIAIIVDTITNDEAKKLWLRFFKSIGVHEGEAAKQLMYLPKSPRQFAIIDTFS